MIRLLFIFACAVTLNGSCVVVDSDQIIAQDLAQADRAFLSLNASLVFSYAPLPGKQRLLSATELSRWAMGNQMADPHPSSICIERSSQILTAAIVETAVRKAFAATPGRVQPRQMQVDVLDFTHSVLPLGELKFELADAGIPPPNRPEVPIIWRGTLKPNRGVSYPIWTRIRILATQRLVRTKLDLKSQSVIDPSAIEEADVLQSPIRYPEADAANFYIGKLLKSALGGGQLLKHDLVQLPPDIDKGTLVHVQVLSGATRLEFEAESDSPGHIGGVISMINPSNQQHFKAKVKSPELVEVRIETGGPSRVRNVERSLVTNHTTSQGSL